MLGGNTYGAPGVLKEVKMANTQKKKIVQIKGYKDKTCPAVQGAGQVYEWNWDNLKKLLS